MTHSTAPAAGKSSLRWILWLIIPAILSIPLVSGWPWTASDYVFAALLLGAVGALIEFAVRQSSNMFYRAAMILATLTGLLLVWINGAVGIVGDENNPVNLLYGLVLLAAVGGAALTRFRAKGMKYALLAAGSVQFAIAAGVALSGAGASEPPGPVGILILNAFFTALWLLSAALFSRAESDDRAAPAS